MKDYYYEKMTHAQATLRLATIGFESFVKSKAREILDSSEFIETIVDDIILCNACLKELETAFEEYSERYNKQLQLEKEAEEALEEENHDCG
jgi:hypothetical protein